MLFSTDRYCLTGSNAEFALWVGLQGEDQAAAQDCLEGLAAVLSRCGEHVSKPWPVAQALLDVVRDGSSSLARKALACFRAILLLSAVQ